jgi:hypothetical protein
MFHSISYIALLAQLAVVPTDHRAEAPLPFDTTIAASAVSNIALALDAGGTVHVVGNDSKVVRVKVTDHGRDCADCVVAVTHAGDGIEVRTARTRAVDSPADLQVRIEVPLRTNVTLTSAGGEVEIEGIDGTVSGMTEFGALHLFRLSGPLMLETKRGDITLRQSYVRGRVHTNDGRVLLEDVGGNVRGTSAHGRVVERRVERVPTAP